MKTCIKNLQAAVWTIAFLLAVVVSAQAEEEQYTPLPDEGKKYEIGTDYSFMYQFADKPKLGVAILKIKLFNKDGKQDTSLKITGASGMPSMPGHHQSGDVPFKLNKKGDYLLPVDVVMRGDWEVKVIFSKGDKDVYRGSIRFDV